MGCAQRRCEGYCEATPDALLDVHGGVTFSGLCRPGDDEAVGICHVPDAGEETDIWWIGFDTAHGGDYSPALEAKLRAYGSALAGDGGEYRTVAYVQNECRRLALQLDDRDWDEHIAAVTHVQPLNP